MYLPHLQPTDASHGVFAPGGYEWWHFDAEDEKGGLIAAVDFFNGCPAHPEYIKRHKQYKSSPTRHAPPLPEEYPCVSAVVYEQHVPILSFHRALGAGKLVASDQALKVSAAASGVRDERPEGGIMVLAVDPASGHRIELTFHPLLRPQSWEGRDWSAAGLHHWVLCDPLCRVEGEVHVGADGSVRKMKGL